MFTAVEEEEEKERDKESFLNNQGGTFFFFPTFSSCKVGADSEAPRRKTEDEDGRGKEYK